MHLAHLAARLRALGPQGTLDRGYALVLDEENRPITQAGQTREGQAVRLVMSKGVAMAEVTSADPAKTLRDLMIPEATPLAPVSAPKKKTSRRKLKPNDPKSDPGAA